MSDTIEIIEQEGTEVVEIFASGPIGPVGPENTAASEAIAAHEALTAEDDDVHGAGSYAQQVVAEAVAILEAADSEEANARATAIAGETTARESAVAAEAADRQEGDLGLSDDISAQATALANAISAINLAIEQAKVDVKNDLIGTASNTYDTLGEIQDALGDDADALAALTIVVGGKQNLDATLTALSGLTTTAFGRMLLGLNNAAALLSAAGAGTAATRDVAASGDASATQVVKGSDTRLSDPRTPSDASVTAAKVAPALKPSGTAASTDESLRRLGTGSTHAAAGDDSRFPTTGQKNALAGLSGTPGSGNEYLTKQTIDTDNTLGANSDVVVPSQKAVAGYVATQAGLLIPKSLVDAKGDILVGTADNTVARKAVGGDGRGLVADSSQSDGLAWGPFFAQKVRQNFQSCSSADTGTTLVDDNELQIPIPGAGCFSFEAALFLVVAGVSPTTPDWKMTFVYTGSITASDSGFSLVSTGATSNWGTITTGQTPGGLTDIGSTISFGGGVAKQAILLRGFLRATNAGTFKLQFAQNTSDAAVNTVNRGSSLVVRGS